jgi:hypothetical protein
MLWATTLSAPTYSTLAVVQPVEIEVLSNYFQLLGRKVQDRENKA